MILESLQSTEKQKTFAQSTWLGWETFILGSWHIGEGIFPRIVNTDFFLKTGMKVPKNWTTKWILGKYYQDMTG